MSLWWTPSEERAAVPSPTLLSSPDIEYPHPIQCHNSPSPLALGIYISRSNGSPLCTLPLFYVSPVAAAHRSPTRDPRNPPGVYPGWYALVWPNTSFEIRTSRVNHRMLGENGEDQINTTLFVDAVDTNNPEAFHVEGLVGDERVASAFVRKFQAAENGEIVREGTRFMFRKREPVENDRSVNSEFAGTIRLQATTGFAVLRENDARSAEYQYDNSTKLDEKRVAKEGKSIGVDKAGETVVQTRKASKYRTVCERLVPEAGITIYLREYSWLQSRRILDQWGVPFTHDSFRAVMGYEVKAKETKGGGRQLGAADVKREAKVRKRRRRNQWRERWKKTKEEYVERTDSIERRGVRQGVVESVALPVVDLVEDEAAGTSSIVNLDSDDVAEASKGGAPVVDLDSEPAVLSWNGSNDVVSLDADDSATRSDCTAVVDLT